jgi:ubiquinone/menaquinone biosynthesis C-methylase UbiE
MSGEGQNHWDKVYTTKSSDRVSWFQVKPEKSLELIHRFMPVARQPIIIDVGGGASTLVDFLLGDEYESISILDLAASALNTAKQRLGSASERVSWIVADITQTELPANTYDLWHDRAVFHFLTIPADRAKYVDLVERSLKSGGILVMSTFAPDGPEKCSNLNINRYDCEDILAILGQNFKLIHSERESHQTPFETQQSFSYCVFEKLSSSLHRQVEI